jgi:hypothetical protein
LFDSEHGLPPLWGLDIDFCLYQTRKNLSRKEIKNREFVEKYFFACQRKSVWLGLGRFGLQEESDARFAVIFSFSPYRASPDRVRPAGDWRKDCRI